MIKLHFYGSLAEKYGKVFEVDAKTPREAISALGYQIPEYREEIVSGKWHVVLGPLKTAKPEDGNNIGEDELDISLSSIKEIHLLPYIEGSGNAVQFIIGLVVFVVGAFTYNAGVMAAGVGMMVGGIIQMTTKIPSPENIAQEDDKKQASFLFNGAINSSKQGVAIPRGYGRMLIGSTVVSGMVYAEQLQVSDD